MPAKQEHVQKAEGNAAFALSLTLDSKPKIDWALIALFYAAMHYVEAYLATQNIHLRSHQTRDNAIGRDSKLKKIFVDYQDLKYYGYAARYEPSTFTPKDVTGMAAPGFATIKAHIKPLL